MSEENIEESRERTSRALKERIKTLKAKGWGRKDIERDLDSIMSRSAVTFLKAGGSSRELVTEYTLFFAIADESIGEGEE